MTDSSAPAQPVQQAVPVHPAALTRRELREQERLAATPLAAAHRAAAADALAVPAVPAVPNAARPIELSADAAQVLADELAEPELAAVTVNDTDRLIAAPAAADAPVTDLDQLLTDAGTPTTSIPLPTRSQVRAAKSGHGAAGAIRALDDGGQPVRPSRTGSRTASRALRSGTMKQSTQRPAVQAPSQRPAPKLRRLATTGVTVVAMAFVALMAVSTSLPAEALLSSADVQAAARLSTQTSPAEPAQTLSMDGGTDTISVTRDGFESKSIAEVAAASGIRMEATFTNNPNGTIQWPFAVGVHIGDRFGYRNCAGCSADHQGQDFNPGIGAPIQSIADGVVSFTEDGEGSLGVHMIIDHVIDGKVVSSVYAHMIHGSMLFKTGDVVKVGQVIGKVGNTGMSTGPHLHFEIRLGGKDGVHVDPLVWLRANTN
ncbi:M23 family metallopeptidase [Cryobacterium sp. MDB1-18-2]|uniref:M23 family metallopeptidase n=1 Tax=unclassified Cryobacterium TaxID=2649013 RepID=UPI00106D3E13|nr:MULTISPECIES: M23 family metallopeptidase [unclassified Cryobacterium]TFC31913.1 M23 family metallopeptidase [Cryobacterium sp. MDB1-18-2]TFC37741.1 M23 family metallopeptidase [Cryobacterium sp. MDB1-18-1]